MMSRPVVNTLGAALIVIAGGLLIHASAADRNPNDPSSSKPYGSEETTSPQQMMSLAGTWQLDRTRGDVKKEPKLESSSKDRDKDRDEMARSSSMEQPGSWVARRLPHLLRITQTGDRISIADSSSTPVEVILLAGADPRRMRPSAPADSAPGHTWSDSMMTRGSDMHGHGADSTMMHGPGMHSQRSDMGMMGAPVQGTGRWEGKSLVVEKTNPESDKQMTQTFTVIDDGRTLEIRTQSSSAGYAEGSKEKDKGNKSFTRYYNRVNS